MLIRCALGLHSLEVLVAVGWWRVMPPAWLWLHGHSHLLHTGAHQLGSPITQSPCIKTVREEPCASLVRRRSHSPLGEVLVAAVAVDAARPGCVGCPTTTSGTTRPCCSGCSGGPLQQGVPACLHAQHTFTHTEAPPDRQHAPPDRQHASPFSLSLADFMQKYGCSGAVR